MSALGEDQFVDVGGRRLHCCVAGEGPVTVLFESGLGKSRLVWALVQPEIAEHARTVTYDRAGLGQSDPAPGKRDFESILRDHLRVFDELAGDACILVGHSYGGPIVRAAAAQRKARVRGILVLDEINENCAQMFGLGYRVFSSAAHRAMQVASFAGFLRPIMQRTYMRQLEGEAAAESRAEEGTVRSQTTACEENSLMMKGISPFRGGKSPDLTGVPYVSISSRRSDDESDIIARAHKITVEEAKGRHVVGAGKAHYLQLTEPDLVVGEIMALINEARV